MNIQNKRGVSVLVSYVLLVVFALAASVIAYQWLKTYVPKENLNCPEGVSILVDNAIFNELYSELTLTLRNKGRFDIAGFFIHGTNISGQENPNIDLSMYLNESASGATKLANSVIFVGTENPFKAGEERTTVFNINYSAGKIYKIRLIPVKFQKQDSKERFVSCGDAKVEHQVIIIPVEKWYVFITSTKTYTGNFGGLSGADNICNNLAAKSNFTKINGTYVAWMSTNTINVKDRINEGIFLGINDTLIARGKRDLLDGTLSNFIKINEKGGVDDSSGSVWTGTDEFGFAVPNKNCNGWTSASGSYSGIQGKLNMTNKEWTNYNTVFCNDTSKVIYCFQVGR